MIPARALFLKSVFHLVPEHELSRGSEETRIFGLAKMFAEPLNCRLTTSYGAEGEASHQRCYARV